MPQRVTEKIGHGHFSVVLLAKGAIMGTMKNATKNELATKTTKELMDLLAAEPANHSAGAAMVSINAAEELLARGVTPEDVAAYEATGVVS